MIPLIKNGDLSEEKKQEIWKEYEQVIKDKLEPEF